MLRDFSLLVTKESQSKDEVNIRNQVIFCQSEFVAGKSTSACCLHICVSDL